MRPLQPNVSRHYISMILGTGTDIVAVERIERLVDKYGERFTRRLFTDRELALCLPRANCYECLAARFAAKEAVMKALGTGYSQGVKYREIEVTGGEDQRPEIALHGATEQVASDWGTGQIHLTISHERSYAVAFVIIENH